MYQKVTYPIFWSPLIWGAKPYGIRVTRLYVCNFNSYNFQRAIVGYLLVHPLPNSQIVESAWLRKNGLGHLVHKGFCPLKFNAQSRVGYVLIHL